MTDIGKISVVLPTYNERVNVVLLIAAIHDQLGSRDHEIVVVDDNSPDGTLQAVQALGDPRVKAIQRTSDPSLAKSIRCGIENAQGSVFVIMDSDFNHQPEYLPFMVDALTHYECVSGSRFVYGGQMNTRLRHLLSWTFNIFTRAMTGGQITDNLYGFIAIRRTVMEQCAYDRIFWGYGDYCIRLLFYLQRQGVRVLQFPAVHGERKAGAGNSRFLWVFWKYFKEVLKLTLNVRLLGRV